MDHMGSPPLPPADYPSHKRKRSQSPPASTPLKTPKTTSAHLQINYLARQYPEILPLISTDDPLPSLLTLITDYDGVLQRHESMAGNLGARPLGPILIQRFERLFDGPPRVLKTHGKEGTTVGWLDVVEFARNKPEQFNLDKMRDSVRVCQFYTKQCRVEINEDDYHLVKSGMPQNMIPPQPIAGDEEKELGTLEIMDGRLGNLVQLADQVSARARQLNHRLRNRRNAIVQRRAAEASTTTLEGGKSPPLRSNENNTASRSLANGHSDSASNSPTGGFIAVNSRQPAPSDRSHTPTSTQTSGPTLTNGVQQGVSAATKAELLSKFTSKGSQASSNEAALRNARRDSNSLGRPFSSNSNSKSNPKPFADSMEYANLLLNNASPQNSIPVAIPNTPSSLLPYVKPTPADRFDDSGPYKADMMARMEQLNRGDRVQPPCDRCRRLHMDCLKNLTACMGCTKKHAKCSWKDVEEQELRDHPFVPRTKPAPVEDMDDGSDADGKSVDGRRSTRDASREVQGVRDEELLGEESDDEQPGRGKQDIQHNRRSPSPSQVNIARVPVPEDLEKLPPPVKLSPPKDSYFASVNKQELRQEAGLDSTESPAKSSDTTLSTGTYQSLKSSYQAPQARMTSTKPTSNGGSNNVQTQYEKDIYSQLHDATRESAERERHTELPRSQTTTNDPSQSEHSPVQRLQERRLPSPPVYAEQIQERKLPSPPTQIQPILERPLPSPPVPYWPGNHASQRPRTPNYIERKYTPPLHKSDEGEPLPPRSSMEDVPLKSESSTAPQTFIPQPPKSWPSPESETIHGSRNDTTSSEAIMNDVPFAKRPASEPMQI